MVNGAFTFAKGVDWLALVLWLCAGVLYPAVEGMAAHAFSPDYSYAHNFISDLGVSTCGTIYAGRTICSPLHALMNANFAFQGVAFLGAALAIARVIAAPSRVALVAFAAMNCLGNILISLFPEDMPGPIAGGLNCHVAGALLAILFGNATALMSSWTFAELRLARVHRLFSIALPILAAIALVMFVVSRGSTSVLFPDGVWERLSVYTITAWELLSAACLFARPTLMAAALARRGG